MRWFAFAILLYCATVLQTTVAPYIAVHTIRPNLMVLVAVYCALLAPAYDAMIACWLIGLMIDLTSLSFTHHSNVGIHAFSLGLISMLIVYTRGLAFRDSVLTHLILSFLTNLAMAVLVGLHLLFILDKTAGETPMGPGSAWEGFREILTMAIWASVYTALLAPYVHWLLHQSRNLLGIGGTRRLGVR